MASSSSCGKTEISLALIAGLQAQGLRVAGMKPVASGCSLHDGRLENDDAARLRAAASLPLDYDLVNPWALREPMAPHICAAREGREIRLPPVQQAYAALARQTDYVVVEGVGGWQVPLSPTLSLPDLVQALDLPVILVVGLRLGCINHALLSARAIHDRGCTLSGWVANQVDPAYPGEKETLDTLRAAIAAPLLGRVPFMREANSAKTAAAHLDLQLLT